MLEGLKARSDLNGRLGVIVCFDAERGRYGVCISAKPEETVFVRPCIIVIPAKTKTIKQPTFIPLPMEEALAKAHSDMAEGFDAENAPIKLARVKLGSAASPPTFVVGLPVVLGKSKAVGKPIVCLVASSRVDGTDSTPLGGTTVHTYARQSTKDAIVFLQENDCADGVLMMFDDGSCSFPKASLLHIWAKMESTDKACHMCIYLDPYHDPAKAMYTLSCQMIWK